MTNSCNICWEDNRKLYKMRGRCSCCSGRTCKSCIRRWVLYQGDNLRCVMCRGPVKVPNRLLRKYELGVCSRLLLLVGFLLSDVVLKTTVVCHNIKVRFNRDHTAVFLGSVTSALVANSTFYHRYYHRLWGFSHMFDRTFFMSNVLIVILYTMYYFIFVSRFRIQEHRLALFLTSTGLVVLTPHFLTSTLITFSRMGEDVVYGMASVSVIMLAAGFIAGSVIVLLYGAHRWGETGYRYALNRFVNRSS